MRIKIWWLALTATLTLVLIGAGVAQPPPGGPDQKGPPDKFGRKGGKKGGMTANDIVERIMSFDKNNVGKVTKDDLPERLQYLIELGDTNKDGALDRDEVKALAAKLAQDGFPGGGPGGKGGFGKGGFGKGGPGVPGAILEQRLADLEERLETMLREVKEMRTLLSKKGPKGPPPDKN
jgi:hypothetical protein